MNVLDIKKTFQEILCKNYKGFTLAKISLIQFFSVKHLKSYCLSVNNTTRLSTICF